ncbi:MAG: prepilin-type N-terminal cleavage/methylation domain-containing protein [Planctomycetes bacterium]|nr:prepilin-type N-terminal cleavage/methylation domain-containing protein [Planctomycetota bacterium]NUQ35286.1 prepilin-type N-terminal cleavage/methylation domain-containing protein [Planctomycetaceae bacterium]
MITRRHSNAFTLIELVVVVALLMIFAGVAIGMTGIGAAPDYQVRSTSRQVAGLMEKARAQAAITGGLVRLVYDIDQQVVFLKVPRLLEEDESPEDFEDDELLEKVGSVSFGYPDDMERSRVWLESVQTYDGIVYDSGEVIIDLRPFGTSIGHVVRIRNPEPLPDDPEIMSVELNPLTGIAAVHEFEKNVAEPVKDFN